MLIFIPVDGYGILSYTVFIRSPTSRMSTIIETCCFCQRVLPPLGNGDTVAHQRVGNNNAYPVRPDGRCCNECNQTIVIRTRLREAYNSDTGRNRLGFINVGMESESDLHAANAELEKVLAVTPIKLSRPGGSGFHRLSEQLISCERLDSAMTALVGEMTMTIGAHIFVIEHDWASAFANADGFDDGEIVLPYDKCVFEFRINGLRTCVLQWKDRGQDFGKCVFFELKTMWLLMRPDCNVQMYFNVRQFIDRQLRAVTIVLDAEVAATEIVRAPERLNRARKKAGKSLLGDYHIVNLNRHRRLQPFEHELGHHASPRCHFRRGHWRRYDNFKTWIKWCLVGDPDLGFVDKHYRL